MPQPDDQRVPGRTSFVAQLPPADREGLHRIGQWRFFAADTVMVHQYERSSHVFVILRGCVKVVSAAGEGYHTVLALRDAGDLVGEQSGLDGRPRSATLRALTDVEALLISATAFSAYRRTRPAVDVAMQRLLSYRLRESDRSLAGVGASSTEGRLAGILLRLAHRYGTAVDGGVHIDLPLSQEDLAGLAFSSRRTIGRLLGEWREAGWIDTGRRSILLLDPGALDSVRAS